MRPLGWNADCSELRCPDAGAGRGFPASKAKVVQRQPLVFAIQGRLESWNIDMKEPESRAHIVMGRESPQKRSLAKGMRRNMTDEEALLWKHLRRNQLRGLHFRRQQVIDGFIADFYCHAAGIVVEVDGLVHDSRREYDHNRDEILSSRGLKVLRFTNEAVTNDLETVLDEIEKASNIP